MKKISTVICISLFPLLLHSQTSVKFASLGDYGVANGDELAVTNMMKSWEPDFIISVGDNNYSVGSFSTIDQNIGQYFHNYIHPYLFGNYGPDTATINRFFPCLGNHDLYTNYGYPYTEYFTLPRNSHNNERYYDYVQGNVHFFVANSDFGGYEFQGNIWESDGIDSNSYQAQWIKNRLAESTSTWNVVYFHHPPYMSIVSGYDSIHKKLRWPFKRWGADVVLNGHSHWYERLNIDNFPYIINGLGGEGVGYEDIGPRRDGSQFFYSDNFGAQLIQSYDDSLVFRFFNVNNELIDYYRIPSLNLRLKVLVEGFYNQNSDSMTTGDTISVYLRDTTEFHTIIDSVKGYLNSKGLCSVAFNNAKNGIPYYIVINKRSLIETWSATGQTFENGYLNYDFTTDSAKAFGENMIQVNNSPLRYSFFSGDVNKDGIVDLLDESLVDNHARRITMGYQNTDINGDGVVDVSDLGIVENNALDFIEIVTP